MKKIAILIILMVSTNASAAFESLQKLEGRDRITASVRVGLVQDDRRLVFRHVRLAAINYLRRIGIIQGELGQQLIAPPPFPQRIVAVPASLDNNPPSAQADIQNEIRLILRYRVIPLGAPDQDAIPFKTQFIDGPDPFPFAFQVDPDELTFGSVVEYHMIAFRLPAGQIITIPEDGTFIRVGVGAAAANQMGPPGGQLSIPDGNPNDGEVSIEFPVNAFSEFTSVSFTEVPVGSPIVPPLNGIPQPVAVYQLTTDIPYSGPARVTVTYPDFSFPTGQDGVLDGTSAPESHAQLVVWDGFSWRPVGSSRDLEANSLSTKIEHFEFLAVVALSGTGPASYRAARKVITPNGDNINDAAIFTFGNSQSVVVKIFDSNGSRVREIIGSGVLEWDGRDSSRNVVESGVYIYQYKLEGQLVSGVIAVVK